MAKKKEAEEQLCTEETVQPEQEQAQEAQPPCQEQPWEEKYLAEHDAYLRLAAEFDNFRKRTVKEKEQTYSLGRADAVEKLLPIYDNLERALAQPTEDAAFKKGVEMTMNELVRTLGTLGVDIYGEKGDLFDPNIHNAVMHTEDEEVEESTITQVFQKGIRMGEKIIRFAMVQVAN